MKVSLNVKFLQGPYGGGMQFAFSLKEFLTQQGITVVNTLKEDDIDIILHIAPLPFQEICSYTYLDAFIYQIEHPKTLIILRVNECDERKKTHYMNQALIEAGNYIDGVVFISTWLKELFEKQGFRKDIPSRVILNGADTSIFNMHEKKKWDQNSKIKVVTHHWGGNMMKGHDVYEQLDALITTDEEIRSKFEFTFIGNIPENVHYIHTKTIQPLSGKTLADELKTHHVYLTATQNEPAGMHHIEGALCGLPIVFLDSGALPEYCSQYGIIFRKDNFRNVLLEMYTDYDKYFEQIKLYPNTAQKMCREFYEFFLDMSKEGSERQRPPKHTSYPWNIPWIRTLSFFRFMLLNTNVALDTTKKLLYAKLKK